MMACAQYKLYFNDQAASAQQLASFEAITVQQEMDSRWVASLEIPLCTDAQGNWVGESATWFQPMNRLRIEVSVQGGAYVPLIDGPIVTCNYDLYMEPGQSMAHVEVHDDGFLLHRDETVKLYNGITDDQIAQQIFDDNSDITKSTQIDAVPAASDLTNTTTVLRGTPMELLQQLVRRNSKAWHAYILPGTKPHASIGCFTKDPTSDSGLPEMVLLGKDRNLLNIRFSSTAASAAVFRGASISLSDGSVDNATADLSDISRLGTDTPSGTAVSRLLPPGKSRNVNLQSAVLAASEEAAYALHADGEVLKDTYPAVLQPYQTVRVAGTNGRLSGLWLIRQVTHSLTRNSYGQKFSLQRNARSAGAGKSNVAVPVPIF
jgi:hypothetical protein